MIAKEGLIFVLTCLILTGLSIYGANRLDSRFLFVLSIILAILTVMVTYFFRDPERLFPQGNNLVLSPADGVVVNVDTLPNHSFVGESAVRISVFLSVFDVHVNRVPASGTVESVLYNKGKYLAAYAEKASDINENAEVTMTTEGGHRIAFKQIAGLIARRIVCHLKPGQQVKAGDRYGMIRFGSRADIIMPANTRIVVNKRDRVHAGRSILAHLPAPEFAHITHTQADDARL